MAKDWVIFFLHLLGGWEVGDGVIQFEWNVC